MEELIKCGPLTFYNTDTPTPSCVACVRLIRESYRSRCALWCGGVDRPWATINQHAKQTRLSLTPTNLKCCHSVFERSWPDVYQKRRMYFHPIHRGPKT